MNKNSAVLLLLISGSVLAQNQSGFDGRKFAAEMSKIMAEGGDPQRIKALSDKMRNAALKNSGVETEESSLLPFFKKLKSIQINENTSDDVISLLGKPLSQSSYNGGKMFSYSAMPSQNTQIVTSIQIGTSDKVTSIKVIKSSHGGSEEIYSKGTIDTPGLMPTPTQTSSSTLMLPDHFPLKESAPDNPTEGQIYFNKTDKHFYGWDGVSWIKLDTKP